MMLSYQNTMVRQILTIKNQFKNKVNLFLFLDVFLANEIDLSMFSTLSEDDLKIIGVSSLHARKVMMNIIEGRIFVYFTIFTLYQVLYNLTAEYFRFKTSNER